MVISLKYGNCNHLAVLFWRASGCSILTNDIVPFCVLRNLDSVR